MESYGTGVGGSRPINNGFVIIGLKPRDERKASADQIINRLRPQLAKVPGATLFMQPRRTSISAAAPAARSINTR